MDRNAQKWMMIFIAVVIALTLLTALTQKKARAADPPLSTITALPDTSTSSDLMIRFTVDHSVAGSMVGIYWRAEGTTGWMYAGAGIESVMWAAPNDNTRYQFYSQVDPEMYREEPTATTYVCTGCFQPSAEDISTLEMVSILAARGFAMEADVPVVEWYWIHPTTGSSVETYTMYFESISQAGDTTSATFPGLVQMDSLYGYGQTPYPLAGELQRVSVAGVDSTGRQGPTSTWAAWFGDDGPPGAAGQPLRHLVMVD